MCAPHCCPLSAETLTCNERCPYLTIPAALPPSAGDDTLSRLVNAAINFKPLFALMKVGEGGVCCAVREEMLPCSNI